MVFLPSSRDKFLTENQCLRLGGGVKGWKGQGGNSLHRHTTALFHMVWVVRTPAPSDQDRD